MPLDKKLILLVVTPVFVKGTVRLPAVTKLMLSVPVPCVSELKEEAPVLPTLIGTSICLSPLVMVRATDVNANW